MFGVHAHRHDVIRGAEEDRESARKGESASRRRRVSGSAWPHATRFAACQASLSFFRVFALSRFRDYLSESIRDVHVKGIPAAEVGTLESLPMFGVHAHCDDVIRARKRIANASVAALKSEKMSGGAPSGTRFGCLLFRVFAINSVMPGVRGRDIAATVSDFHSAPKLELGNQDGKGERRR